MSLFHITIDPSRSHGAYLYDTHHGFEVLDLFGMYASLPLGYNHPELSGWKFNSEVLSYAGAKIANCEFDSASAKYFRDSFMGHPAMRDFTHFHFCCTGALAIEAAVKTVFHHMGGEGKILTFDSSFHGINGYGGFLASAEGPAGARLAGLPSGDLAYVMDDPTAETWPQVLEEVEYALKQPGRHRDDRVVGVLVEPIQCTAGDHVLPVPFLRALSRVCASAGVPLMFDEVQTGFGGTGTMWYAQQIGVLPDIIVFGKKTQVSGIMARPAVSGIFQDPARLQVTFDGDVIDMIRCRYILEAYDRDGILVNVQQRSAQLLEVIHGLRAVGLLLALDFESQLARDAFVRFMWQEQHTIVIPTGERTVRMRPHLALSHPETLDVIARVKAGLQAVVA